MHLETMTREFRFARCLQNIHLHQIGQDPVHLVLGLAGDKLRRLLIEGGDQSHSGQGKANLMLIQVHLLIGEIQRSQGVLIELALRDLERTV